MEYNVCKTCGACDGRAGFLINGECQNCYDTRRRGDVVIHANLPRTDKEIQRTVQIVSHPEQDLHP